MYAVHSLPLNSFICIFSLMDKFLNPFRINDTFNEKSQDFHQLCYYFAILSHG